MRALIRSILIVSSLLAVVPAQAVVSTSASASTGLVGSMSSGNTFASFALADSASVDAHDVPVEWDSDTGVVACAAIASWRRVRTQIGGFYYVPTYRYVYDGGCGRLTLTMDPIQDLARVRGSLRSWYGGGRISVDLTFRALTPYLPYVSAMRGDPSNVWFYPSLTKPGDSVRADSYLRAGTGLRREANMTGTIRSQVAALAKESGKGHMYRGARFELSAGGGEEG